MLFNILPQTNIHRNHIKAKGLLFHLVTAMMEKKSSQFVTDYSQPVSYTVW